VYGMYINSTSRSLKGNTGIRYKNVQSTEHKIRLYTALNSRELALISNYKCISRAADYTIYVASSLKIKKTELVNYYHVYFL
jgi:hypothetical protein